MTFTRAAVAIALGALLPTVGAFEVLRQDSGLLVESQYWLNVGVVFVTSLGASTVATLTILARSLGIEVPETPAKTGG